MKKLVAVVLLAACELQPAPKQEPAPAPSPPAVTPADAPAPVPPPVDAALPDAGPPKIEISAPCLEVGAKIAQVFIDSAKDPVQHTALEQQRADMTRKTGEACTTQGWSEQARKCYLAAKTPAQIKACETKFTPPPAPAKAPAQPAAGAGSAGEAKGPGGMHPEPGVPRR
jgi:hypothetical protein